MNSIVKFKKLVDSLTPEENESLIHYIINDYLQVSVEGYDSGKTVRLITEGYNAGRTVRLTPAKRCPHCGK